MNPAIKRIADKMITGKNVAFTGAGISTESGIPDYRSQGGLWDKFEPVYFDDFMSRESARIEYWRQKATMYDDLKNAKPNAAHLALADLYHQGRLAAIITQNIDGLHHESGIPDENIIELHGNTRRVRCMSCHAISSDHEAFKRIASGDPAPECPCGGYLKPDTISFGQAMPEAEVKKATALARECDLFLVVGSTLLVQPAALLPDIARRSGAFLAIVNLSETPYDAVCDILVQGKAGEVLPSISQQVLK
jgi:NAD-dependent deacetylase